MNQTPQPSDPDNDYRVTVSDTTVVCHRPDGTTESVTWSELQKVEILTTADGPFFPDVFWVLVGLTDGCVIPWGAAGEEGLLSRLQALPGFRNEVLIEAASMTSQNQLLCWEQTSTDN